MIGYYILFQPVLEYRTFTDLTLSLGPEDWDFRVLFDNIKKDIPNLLCRYVTSY